MILGDDNDNYVKNVTRAVYLNKQHIKMQHFSMLMSRHRLTVLLKILHCSQLANFMEVGKVIRQKNYCIKYQFLQVSGSRPPYCRCPTQSSILPHPVFSIRKVLKSLIFQRYFLGASSLIFQRYFLGAS